GLALLQLALERLSQRGQLSYSAQSDQGLLATTFSTAAFELHRLEVQPEKRYVFSRFALVRRVGDHVVIESARSPAQIVIHDARVVALAAHLVTPRRLDTACCGLTQEEVAVVTSLLLGCNIL